MLYMVAYGVHAWTDLTCYLLSMVVLVMAPVRLNLNLREKGKEVICYKRHERQTRIDAS